MNKLQITLATCSALFLMVVSVGTVSAQLSEGQSVDKIVAVVGKEIILESDIQSNIALLAQQAKDVNPNDPKVRQKILDALINERLTLLTETSGMKLWVEVEDLYSDTKEPAGTLVMLHVPQNLEL